MSIEGLILIIGILAIFGLFSSVLAWGARQTNAAGRAKRDSSLVELPKNTAPKNEYTHAA